MRLPIPLFKARGIDSERLKTYYEEIVKSGIFTNFGPYYQKAVAKLKEIYPNKEFILCNNGTNTLRAILQAKFPRGSRIAIPNFTFVATINAVLDAGMVPVILPTSPKSWTIAYGALKDYQDLYDGFVSVSPFGNDPRYQYEVTAQHLGKTVVFDCAAGWGQDFNQTKAPISVSLHATKNLPIGEGGMIVLDKDDPDFAKMKSLISFGLDDAKLIQEKHGFNGKVDEIHCAILCDQLDHRQYHDVETLVTASLIGRYCRDLAIFDLQTVPLMTPQLPVFHVGGDFELLMKRADKAWITVRRYYWPLLNHAYPEYIVPFATNYHDDYFSKFLALPKNLGYNEFEYVIKNLLGER